MSQPGPFLVRAPGQWLSAGDWNTVQSRMREEIASHDHRAQKLSGGAIEPSAQLQFRAVEIDGALSVGDRSLRERAGKLVEAPREAQLTPKLPASGGTIRGDLRVAGSATVSGSVRVGSAPTVAGRTLGPPRLGALRVIVGPSGALRGQLYETSNTSDGSVFRWVEGRWTDTDNPTTFELTLGAESLVELVARVSGLPVNNLSGSAGGTLVRWADGAWQAVGDGFSVAATSGRPTADEAHRFLVLPAGAHRFRLELGVYNCFARAELLALVRPVEVP